MRSRAQRGEFMPTLRQRLGQFPLPRHYYTWPSEKKLFIDINIVDLTDRRRFGPSIDPNPCRDNSCRGTAVLQVPNTLPGTRVTVAPLEPCPDYCMSELRASSPTSSSCGRY
jgi:hypothetical protein